MKIRSHFWACYVSLVIGFGLVLGTGLITTLGSWYSDDITYRRQTEALIHGRFALDTDPGRLTWDMVWSRGKIQQPWGLGASAWRAPFDILAKLLGREAFPDRISFAVAVSFLVYIVLRLFMYAPPHHAVDEDHGTFWHFDALAAVLFLVLFPPFVTLCRTRFRTYEEAAAFAYLTGIGLFCATLAFIRNPNLLR